MSAWPKIGDGEEVMPEMKGYKMACCDCGLVHLMDFKVVEVVDTKKHGQIATIEPDNIGQLRVVLTAYRDEVATMERRESNTAEAISYLDELLQCQARLMFAKKNYDEEEATAFGVAIMDFMRKHGMTLRAALADAAISGAAGVG